MTVLALPAPVHALPAPAGTPAVAIPDVMRRLGVNLLVACGVPAVLLYVMLQAYGLAPAVLSALAWSYGAMAWRRLTDRPTSGLLVLTVAVLTIRTAFTLGTGNHYVYFLEPIVTDGIVALLFLLSLASNRPLVARLAADFYPVTPRLAAVPRVRRLFRRLTLMWGGVCLLKSGVGLWLLGALPVADFVLVKTSATIGLTVLAVAVTIWAATVVLRAEELCP